jgi:hypothetical protein
MTIVMLALLLVTIWRLTRLLVVDEFPPLRLLRERIIDTFGYVNENGELTRGRRLGGLGWSIAYLWTCPWCMSVWVGAGLVWLQNWLYPGSVPLSRAWLVVAAGSLASGWAHMLEAGFDQRWKLRQREIDDVKPRRT